MKKQTCKDPAARPEETAKALAKAAVQTAQRSLFTAQLARCAESRRQPVEGENKGSERMPSCGTARCATDALNTIQAAQRFRSGRVT